MRILLIRHGAVDLLGRVLYGRMPGVHLNEEGLAQAHRMTEVLKKRYRIDEVVSSPLERALETAQIVADAHALGVTVDEGVNEVDVGAWMGRSFGEIFEDDLWKRYNQFRSIASPPGGELIMQVQTRALASLEQIVARHRSLDNATAAIVSHGDVIRSLLILLLGMPVDHIHRLEVAPASVSEVLFGLAQPRVLNINQVF